jgi:hypothetical protein
MNGPWHDHDLPWQVPDERRRRQRRLCQRGEVLNGEAERRLRSRGVLEPIL